MKRLIFPIVLASVIGVAAAAAPASAFPRGGRVRGGVAHGGFARPIVIPTRRFYGPAFGWGVAYDPWWYGGVVPYAVPTGVVTGGLRLEVTPKTADVFVDGAFAGVVDDFNGRLQHVTLAPGGHHIEITAPGFAPLAFDTYIQPDKTTDYKGALETD